MAENITDLMVGLGLDVDQKSFQSGMSAFNGIRSAAMGLAGVLATSFGASQVTGIARMADQLDRSAQRLGTSAGYMSQLGFAYRQVGSDAQSATSDLQTMQKLLDDLRVNPSGDSFAMLSAAGLDAGYIAQADSAREGLERMIEQGNRVNVDDRRMAFDSLGLSEGAFSMSTEGSEFYQEQLAYSKQQNDMTQELVNQSREFNRGMNRLLETTSGIRNVLAGEILATLTPMLDSINNWLAADGRLDQIKDAANTSPVEWGERAVDAAGNKLMELLPESVQKGIEKAGSYLKPEGFDPDPVGTFMRNRGWAPGGDGGNDNGAPAAPVMSTQPPETPAPSGSLRDDPEIRAAVRANAARIGAPEGLLWAQLGVESDYNPNAVSRAGARGLAQVMPDTEKALEKRFGRELDPFDPMDAIEMQAELMRENKARFGNWEDASRAYNGGWKKDSKAWASRENQEYYPKIQDRMRQQGASSGTTNQSISININGAQDSKAVAREVQQVLKDNAQRTAQDFSTGAI